MMNTTFNKATAATLGGAAVSIVASIWPVGPEIQGALQTLITAALVYLIANKEPS